MDKESQRSAFAIHGWWLSLGLLAAEAAGTVVARSLLLLLYWQNNRSGFLVASGVAGFRLVLRLGPTLEWESRRQTGKI
jgi:hypothetical protein